MSPITERCIERGAELFAHGLTDAQVGRVLDAEFNLGDSTPCAIEAAGSRHYYKFHLPRVERAVQFHARIHRLTGKRQPLYGSRANHEQRDAAV